MRKERTAVAAAVLWFLVLAISLQARVEIKPGFNSFSPEQDIQLGQQAARDVAKQFPISNDAQMNDYINRLGKRLASYAPGYKFPYQFHVVNQKQINAFALPGGLVYVHTATILAAANEAQLAGVIAHEISHVALRHSTNQASKAMLAQAPLAILGGVLGSGGLAGQVAQLGIAFGVNSAFLKFSRGAERQADELGSQIMYDAGYDPMAMAQFFQTLEKQGGGQSLEFLSDHPNPGNRVKDVTQLVPKLGPAKALSAGNNSDFEQIKRHVAQIQSTAPSGSPKGAGGSPPPQPSRNSKSYKNNLYSISYPDNWQVYGEGSDSVTIVPQEGVVPGDGDSLPQITYGAVSGIFEPTADSRGRQPTLSAATNELIAQLQRSNPDLRVVPGSSSNFRLDGQPALSVIAGGQSALGGSEVNLIATTFRPEGLWYIVFIAPEQQWDGYKPLYQQMLSSVRFPR